ncbi:hypothetical protein [Barrientosiimonas endolithica]|nr:hypothetical protein [Barrientosiimonas endolithica]
MAILAVMLAAISAMVSALTTRTGLSVTGVIVTLMITSGMVTALLGIAYENVNETLAFVAAALNPFTAVAALVSGLFDQPTPIELLPRVTTPGWTLFFVVVAAAWVLVPTAILLARTRKAASL